MLSWLLVCNLPSSATEPVFIGLDGEFGYAGSTSAEAIRMGLEIAIEEINQAGGVLQGRKLVLQERANHSVPARSIENIEEFAKQPDLVAVFCGRFSPTVLESLPSIHRAGLPLLNPWAAADPIVDNGYQPNYVFRLSLRDSWAMTVMLDAAAARGKTRVGMLLLNTSWGRSNLKAAETYMASHPAMQLVGVRWFNWQDASFIERYQSLRQAGAQAIINVSGPPEAVILVKEIAPLPPTERLPILSHWGITGGHFAEEAGESLKQVDFSVVQTYSFVGATDARAQQVLAAAKRRYGIDDARKLMAPVGVAHAYDLTHILALAIDQAGSTERKAIRNALERVKNYQGLIKHYAQPFSPTRHEALAPNDVFMASFAADGAMLRLGAKPTAKKP